MKKNRTIHRTASLATLVPQGFNPEATGLTLTSAQNVACSREGIIIFNKPGTVEYNLTNQSGNIIECGAIKFDHDEYRLPTGKKLLVLSNGDWAYMGAKWYSNLPNLLPNLPPSESTVGTVTWDVDMGSTQAVTIHSECRKLSATDWVTDKANSPLFDNGKLDFANYADNAGLTNDTVVIIRLALDVKKTESLNKELSSLVKLRNLFLRKTKTVYVVTPLLGSYQSLITRNAKYAQMIRDTFADNTIDVAMLGAPYAAGYYLSTNSKTPQTSVVSSLNEGYDFVVDNAADNLGTAIIKCAAKKVIDSEL